MLTHVYWMADSKGIVLYTGGLEPQKKKIECRKKEVNYFKVKSLDSNLIRLSSELQNFLKRKKNRNKVDK